MRCVRGTDVRKSGSFAALALAVLVVVGCGSDRADAPAKPVEPKPTPTAEQQPPDPHTPPILAADIARVAELLTFHGRAETITCELLIRMKPANGDALTFQIFLWCPADGRIRLKASKLDVDFCEALVQPDGSFTAVLVRSHEVVRGNIKDISVLDAQGRPLGPPFLAYLALLVAEAKTGPIPDSGITAVGERSIQAKDATSGLTVGVDLNADNTAATKRFYDAPGKESLRFDYSRYQQFDGLRRPAKLTVTVPNDPSEYGVKVRGIDVVPSIDPVRMKLETSQGLHEIKLMEFLDRLRE